MEKNEQERLIKALEQQTEETAALRKEVEAVKGWLKELNATLKGIAHLLGRGSR